MIVFFGNDFIINRILFDFFLMYYNNINIMCIKLRIKKIIVMWMKEIFNFKFINILINIMFNIIIFIRFISICYFYIKNYYIMYYYNYYNIYY